MPHADRRTMLKISLAGTGAMIAAPVVGEAAQPVVGARDYNRLAVRHRYVEVEGLNIFYREAGSPDAPAVLLLHGFPTSSHMFRHLILALADRYRVVAPD